MVISYENQRVIDYSRDGIPHPAVALYEKTTDDIEAVAGLVAKKGTASNQAKICGAADVPIGLFDKQKNHQPLVSGKENTNYAEDGEPVNVIGQCKLAFFQLTTSQTIVTGTGLEVMAGGLVTTLATGTKVAIAAEDKTTTGTEAFILAWNLINKA